MFRFIIPLAGKDGSDDGIEFSAHGASLPSNLSHGDVCQTFYFIRKGWLCPVSIVKSKVHNRIIRCIIILLKITYFFLRSNNVNSTS